MDLEELRNEVNGAGNRKTKKVRKKRREGEGRGKEEEQG